MPSRFESTTWLVGCPALVLAGSETTDELTAIARRAARATDGAELRVLQGVDHMAPRVAPEVLARELISFIRT